MPTISKTHSQARKRRLERKRREKKLREKGSIQLVNKRTDRIKGEFPAAVETARIEFQLLLTRVSLYSSAREAFAKKMSYVLSVPFLEAVEKISSRLPIVLAQSSDQAKVDAWQERLSQYDIELEVHQSSLS